MKQDGTFQSRRGGLLDRDLSGIGKRLLPPVTFFAIAFAIDMLTRQQYSSVWGSAAIVASVIYLFPAIRPALIAIGTYAAVWIGFNLVRAFADDAGMSVAGIEAVAGWERGLFGGLLPSASLQDSFFSPEDIGIHDIMLSLVHGSFFIVPFTVAGIVWWKHRDHFLPYTVATAITFALGILGFVLLPTSPPWMADPENVSRVTSHVLDQTLGVSLSSDAVGSPVGGFSFEPNHLAAMPSVHVAATILVYLIVRQFGRIAAALGAIYGLLMTIGVVYLGEHYVLDAVFGWVIAIAGWLLMQRLLTNDIGQR